MAVTSEPTIGAQPRFQSHDGETPIRIDFHAIVQSEKNSNRSWPVVLRSLGEVTAKFRAPRFFGSLKLAGCRCRPGPLLGPVSECGTINVYLWSEMNIMCGMFSRRFDSGPYVDSCFLSVNFDSEPSCGNLISLGIVLMSSRTCVKFFLGLHMEKSTD